MKKILIAIDNDFIRQTNVDIFRADGFEVINTKSGIEALDLARIEKPDFILADIDFVGMKRFELIERLRKESHTKKIPVVVFSQLDNREDRQKAMDLEVKDFITIDSISPTELVRKARIILREQKNYHIDVPIKKAGAMKELLNDLNCDTKPICSKCRSKVQMRLLRDLSAGRNHFIISFVCSKCK